MPLGPLFYRALETDKIVGIKRHRQNYDTEIELSEACSELVWWKNDLKNSFQGLVIPTNDITIFTDARETGWGITDGHNPSESQCAEHERMHINAPEPEAAFIGIRTYCHNRSYKHIRVISDSSIAIACINNKGGTKFGKCNDIAQEIWLWCFKNNSIVFAAQIQGKQNIEGDKFSKKIYNNTEWQDIFCNHR